MSRLQGLCQSLTQFVHGRAGGGNQSPPERITEGVDGPRQDMQGNRKFREGFRRRSNGVYRDFVRRELKELACGQLHVSGNDSFGIICGPLNRREPEKPVNQRS